MKHLRWIGMTIALLAMSATAARADDLKVIANNSVRVDSISAIDLKSIFLGEKTTLPGGIHVEPVLAHHGFAHEAFLRHVIGRTDSDLQSYYRSLVFTGRASMPKSLESDAQIVAYVAATRGAIGYVDFEAKADGVRTLAVTGSDSERKLISWVKAEYPLVLKSRGLGGTVRLRVKIAADGGVAGVEVIGGDAALGEAAASAVAKWKYAPAASQTTTVVSITFSPDE